MKEKISKFNDYVGDGISYWLSTMVLFYVISAFVLIPLFFQRPHDLIGWIQFIIQSFFQGAALPVLGYTSRKAGESQERLLKETHDTVMEQFSYMRGDIAIEAEERQNIKHLVEDVHHLLKDLHKGGTGVNE